MHYFKAFFGALLCIILLFYGKADSSFAADPEIEQLKRQMKTMQQQMTDMQEKINALEERNTDLRKKIVEQEVEKDEKPDPA